MKNQNSEVFCPEESDLASRASARHLRSRVEQAVTQGKIAVIDLTSVLSISESYADELLAVLVEQYGLEWFANNIKVLHQQPHSEHVLLTIATEIRRRLEKQNTLNIKSSVDNLIALKKNKQSNWHKETMK